MEKVIDAEVISCEEKLIKNKSKDERDLNFEVLRIISMLMIVIFHFSDWGGIKNIVDPIENRFFGQFINIFGGIGNNLFVLISGYYLINSKFKTKKLIRIIFEVWVYSVALYILSLLLNINTFDYKTCIKVLLPITYNMNWFATTYVGLYLLFPFINKLINSISKRSFEILLIIIGTLTCIIPTILNSAVFYSDLVWFVFIYAVAAYIRKNDIKFKNNKVNIFIIVTILALMLTFSIICVKMEMNKYEIYFNTKSTIPTLTVSIFIFMTFKNLKLKYNKVIAMVAKSTFGVYLIHINSSIRVYLFANILKIQNYYERNIIALMAYVLTTAIAIYLICTVIDIIRIKILEEPIFKIKWFDKYFDKIDKTMNEI